MPDEPGGWELHRNLEQTRRDLQAAIDRAENHVTENGLAVLLARVNDQLNEHAKDIADERGFRTADVTALRDWVKVELERLERRADKGEQRTADQERERRADRRIVYAGALTAAVSLLLWVLDKAGGVG